MYYVITVISGGLVSQATAETVPAAERAVRQLLDDHFEARPDTRSARKYARTSIVGPFLGRAQDY